MFLEQALYILCALTLISFFLFHEIVGSKLTCLQNKVLHGVDEDIIKSEALQIYKPFELQNAYGSGDGLYIAPLFSLV